MAERPDRPPRATAPGRPATRRTRRARDRERRWRPRPARPAPPPARIGRESAGAPRSAAAPARPTIPRAARDPSCRPGSRRPRPSRRRRAPTGRPRWPPTAHAARPASCHRRRGPRTGSTGCGPRHRGSGERPARRLKLEPKPVRRRVEADQTGRQSVVTRRAAATQGREGNVGGVGRLAGRFERVAAPDDVHLVGIPGATGKQTVRYAHAPQGTVAICAATPQALGVGLRGRAALARCASRRGWSRPPRPSPPRCVHSHWSVVRDVRDRVVREHRP